MILFTGFSYRSVEGRFLTSTVFGATAVHMPSFADSHVTQRRLIRMSFIVLSHSANQGPDDGPQAKGRVGYLLQNDFESMNQRLPTNKRKPPQDFDKPGLDVVM